MKKLWTASLIFLLLGNTFDGLVTYWDVQVYGIHVEGNALARRITQHLGPLPVLVLIKIIFGSIFLLAVVYYWRRCWVEVLGPWVGTGFCATLNLSLGIGYALSGAGWWASILPNRVVGLAVYLSGSLVGWTIVAAGGFLLELLPSCAMLPVLFLLDMRRRQDSEF